MFGARVRNRAAVVIVEGPPTRDLASLAQIATQFQVTRLRVLGP
jgi:hypothetical protein